MPVMPTYPTPPQAARDILTLTLRDLASRTAQLGNPAIMWLVTQPPYREHMTALDQAVLREDLDGAKDAGRALIRWAKARLADPALVQQCQQDAERIAAMQAAEPMKGRQG